MLLINPATEQFGGFLSRYVPVGIPVAIGTLAAYMMKFGHKVNVSDDEIEQISEENLEKHLEGLPKPYVFGITVLTAQAQRTYDLIAMFKRRYPDCLVVLGGIHVTSLPHEGIQNGADIVVRGEGELALKAIYEKFRAGEDWSGVKGITYRDKEGLIRGNEDAMLLEDIDEVPMFPYELFENPKYDMGFITSARGCPYKCSYCSQRLMTGLSYRYHSPERIVANLDILINKYGQKHIVFYDDNFSFKKKRVFELCDAIEASGLHKKASFFVQTRADNFYKDIVPAMKRAGFTGVGFGMETAVERLASHIVKGQTVERHKEAIALARENDIDVSVFMIFALPTETHEDRMESYDFIQDYGMNFTKFNNLIPYPGTKLYNELKHTPQIKIQKGWTNFNSTLTATRSIFDATPLPYVPEGTHPWDLKRDIMKCNLGFYFTPRMIVDVLMRKGGPGFVMLPPKWWLKPREIINMARMGGTLFMNYIVALMPFWMGYALFRLVSGETLEERISDDATYGRKNLMREDEKPAAIDGTMRTIKVDRTKKKAAAAAAATSLPTP